MRRSTPKDVLGTNHIFILKMKGAEVLYVCERAYRKAQRLGKIVHKQNATNANLTCTTSNKEA